MIFDTHAHYNDEAFAGDLDEITEKFAGCGIGKAVNVASDLESIGEVLELTKRFPLFYAALGIHPSDSGELTEDDLEGIRAHLSDPGVVAVGEIGLDYYWKEPDKEIQKKWFIRQLQMARDADLPVIIHSRDAAADTMEILKEYGTGQGVIHCYSYSAEMAKEFVAMGYYIGVGGVVTFKNGRKLKETVAQIPPERIVLETDCPYLAPVPHRGERNSSLYLPLVVSEVASILGITEEETEALTWNNALKLYRLDQNA